MSTLLWKSFFENDVATFRQVLAQATLNAASAHGTKAGRPGTAALSSSPASHLAASPTLTQKSRKTSELSISAAGLQSATPKTLANIALNRSDLNWSDSKGLTLLHHIASSTNDNASDFAKALLEQPLLDLYAQDEESGWTALHRALYFGNIAIARALMDRDINDAIKHSNPGAIRTAGGLIKIKDREGNSPFDLYGASIANRIIRQAPDIASLAGPLDDDDEMAQGVSGDAEGGGEVSKNLAPRTLLNGDEMFAFGSNKNFTLGFGDEDDRQFPERILLKRPDRLVRRFLQEYADANTTSKSPNTSSTSTSSNPLKIVPALVQYRPILVQDVRLSKLHSAILTTDPEANLFMCGFGPGGRLGMGDEITRFSFANVHGGGLLGKKMIAIGLGQDHTIAVSNEGVVFTWGSNTFGQLGYTLNPGGSKKDKKPIQLIPRQVFGPLKRETIVGAAASRIHSVVFTPVSLYTFGKNEGQLGLVDSDARSRSTQETPRKVAASLFSSAIHSVSAIEKATICLLENHEVWVFANYGYTKMSFPLDSLSYYFLQTVSGSVTQRMPMGTIRGNEISRITSGGDTICAMSSMGDVFTVHVSQKYDSSPGSVSTTNPAKIRGALSQPQRVWSLKKAHMAVRDVDVGQDGSIIICTESGSVWRRVKRAKIKDATTAGTSDYKAKDYKFSRVPRLTRVVAVRSNVFGGFAALRRDYDVLKTQVDVEPKTLWKDLYPLLPFYGFGEENSDTEEPAPRFWTSSQPNDVATIRRAVIYSHNIDEEMASFLADRGLSQPSSLNIQLGTTTSDVRIPMHEFVFAGRSAVMRNALREFRNEYFFSLPEILTIEYDKQGKILVLFQGFDFISILNLVLYMYTDSTVDVWHHTKRAPQLAFTYRQIRSEMLRLSSHLEMRKLEHSVRVMSEPPKTLHEDFDLAIRHPHYFANGDVEIELDGSSIKVHSAMICQRCQFFEGLFKGRAAGQWLSTRREHLQEPHEPIKVDLKHVDPKIFEFVLQHLYTDADEQMFDGVVSADLDAFLDLVVDVLSVANELMLDRLSQSCQKVLGRHVNTRNVCQLLNAVAPCSVTEFRDAALEYICLNLEDMLENHLLGELDEDLMLELDAVVRENQLNCLPVSKSGRAELELLENHPELMEKIEYSKRVKVDAVSLHSRLHERESRQGAAAKAKADFLEDFEPSPSMQKDQRRKTSREHAGSPKSPSLVAQSSPVLAGSRSPLLAPFQSPQLAARKSSTDLMFDMEDHDDGKGAFQTPKRKHRRTTDSPREQPVGLGLEDDEAFPILRLSQSPGATAGLSTSVKNRSSQKAFSGPKDQEHRRSTSYELGSWTSSPFRNLRSDATDTVPQSSFGGISNVSSFNNSVNAQKASSSDSLPTKMSQKERKRQVQTQQTSQATTAVTIMPSPDTMIKHSAPKTPSSPWQIASRGPRVNLKDVLDTEKHDSISPTTPGVRVPSPMTLRQTVSGKPPLSKRSVSGPASSVATPSEQQGPKNLKNAQTPFQSPSSSTPPTIHSIRHHHTPPTDVEPTLQLSMADILAQQNREKELLKEAAAKKSLQEIQEEQAFQEWWDLESRKVREEEKEVEAAAAAARSAGSGGRRGKGGGRGRGRSRSGKEGGRDEGGKGKGKEKESGSGGGGGGGESSKMGQKGSGATNNNTGERGRGRGG